VIGRRPPVPIDDLRAVLAHVRSLETRSAVRSTRAKLAASAAFLLILAGSLRALPPHAYLSPSPSHHEENRMRTLQSLGVVSSIALSSSAALAQDAVQWRLEDGGNGHWYRVFNDPRDWNSANAQCSLIGAHLGTVTTAAEDDFVKDLVGRSGGDQPWLGASQLSGQSASFGWSWITGEPWIYTGWCLGEPNDSGVDERFLQYHSSSCGWNDNRLLDCSYVAEWSADCNNDGIVDYGQILRFQLIDDNGNNVPDCCESKLGCQSSAVQWPVTEGGNGHWYVLTNGYERWPNARIQAQDMGADLATMTSAEENAFIASAFNGLRFWLGARRSSTNFSTFEWVTGEAWSYESWRPGEPNTCNPCGQAEFVQSGNGLWDDTGLVVNATPDHPGFPGLVEFTADCNNDGIVDYGQIRAGELEDLDANNIPDCCENGTNCDPCRADIDQSGNVTGVDLAAILNNWGTSGGKQPRSDVNGDGVVDGADLAELLNSWGPCP
jgi:hypothetical protein